VGGEERGGGDVAMLRSWDESVQAIACGEGEGSSWSKASIGAFIGAFERGRGGGGGWGTTAHTAVWTREKWKKRKYFANPATRQPVGRGAGQTRKRREAPAAVGRGGCRRCRKCDDGCRIHDLVPCCYNFLCAENPILFPKNSGP
jgi:hypothetical protein